MLYFFSNGYSQNNFDELLDNLRFLSSAELKGRLPGTQGFDIASNYCIDKFKSYGIKSFDNIENYKQYFEVENNLIIGPCEFNILHSSKGFIKLKHGIDYIYRGFTGSGKYNLDVVFCGFGISVDNYDDYKDIDVKDKAVLIFKANPAFPELNLSPFSVRGRIKTAVEKGAKAVIFVSPPDSKMKTPIGSVSDGKGTQYINIPTIEISPEIASILFDGTNYKLDELHREITELKVSKSLKLQSKVLIDIKAVYNPKLKTYNTIGYLEGKDTKKKEKYILLSAHIDHVGSQCEVIFPGANDNASGTSAVLELAKIFSKIKPDYSMIFALFSAEESGIEGSTYFAENLPVPSESIIAALNFDCIASGDSLQLGNGITSPNLFNLAKSIDKYKFIVKETWANGGADLSPIVNKGIPGLYFVTKYSYTHLHLQSDTYENLNLELLKKVVDFSVSLVNEIINDKYSGENKQQ